MNSDFNLDYRPHEECLSGLPRVWADPSLKGIVSCPMLREVVDNTTKYFDSITSAVFPLKELHIRVIDPKKEGLSIKPHQVISSLIATMAKELFQTTPSRVHFDVFNIENYKNGNFGCLSYSKVTAYHLKMMELVAKHLKNQSEIIKPVNQSEFLGKLQLPNLTDYLSELIVDSKRLKNACNNYWQIECFNSHSSESDAIYTGVFLPLLTLPGVRELH